MKIRAVLSSKLMALAGILSAGVSAVPAMAAGDDYSSILTGLDTSTAVTAIIGAGALLAGVGFAKWATKKVARFFG